mgnify:CR=1 FL=1
MFRMVFLVSLFSALAAPAMAAQKTAYFAGGCFWCTEADFEKIDGVGDVISGFMGGKQANPSYNDVAYGRTTHRETVKVPYDDAKVSYQELLSAFWRMHDPSDPMAALSIGGATTAARFTTPTANKNASPKGPSRR